jgi:hypothetical protein
MGDLLKITRMRTVENRLHWVPTLVGLLFAGQCFGCEPPAGFVNPPRPEIAPLESMLSHSEVRYVDQPLAAVTRAANRPLRIDATKDLPGVTGTYRLSNGPYGTVGSRRLVCRTDGTTAVEEVLLTEANENTTRFRYVVWNYGSPKYRDIDHAVGEFVRTQIAPDKTRVTWTYRFALKSGVSSEARADFQQDFLERQFAEWMRTQLDRKDPDAAVAPGTRRPGLSGVCELPPGFVNPPRPEVAPLEQLLSHTEVIEVARPIKAAAQSGNRPLHEAIRPTKDVPGVSGTLRLSDGPYGTVGARRLVCLTDGSITVEEVLLAESNDQGSRFRYLVWNYTGAKFQDVHYAVGEIVRTSPAPDKTLVNWTYRFALKSGLGAAEKNRFRQTFLESAFADWMHSQLERGRLHAEASL